MVETLNEIKQKAINEPNYDCTEIADDLMRIMFREYSREGTIFEFQNELSIPNSIGTHNFNILEYNQVNSYVNHFVYVLDNMCYDVRYSENAIPFDIYLSEIINLNRKYGIKLKCRIEGDIKWRIL